MTWRTELFTKISQKIWKQQQHQNIILDLTTWKFWSVYNKRQHIKHYKCDSDTEALTKLPYLNPASIIKWEPNKSVINSHYLHSRWVMKQIVWQDAAITDRLFIYPHYDWWDQYWLIFELIPQDEDFIRSFILG